MGGKTMYCLMDEVTDHRQQACLKLLCFADAAKSILEVQLHVKDGLSGILSRVVNIHEVIGIKM